MSNSHYTQSLDSANIADLIDWYARGLLVGIVSERDGGIIGYTHRDRADEFVSALADTAIQPVRGETAYIVDQVGATMAFGTSHDAAVFAEQEREAGAEELEAYTVTIPRDGMTWYEVAEYGCMIGPR